MNRLVLNSENQTLINLKENRKNDSIDLAFVKQFIQKEGVTWESDQMSELIKSIYMLNESPYRNKAIIDSLNLFRAKLIDQNSTYSDSIGINKVIKSAIKDIEKMNTEKESIYAYYPDFTMILLVIIPKENPLEAYFRRYYLTRKSKFFID